MDARNYKAQVVRFLSRADNLYEAKLSVFAEEMGVCVATARQKLMPYGGWMALRAAEIEKRVGLSDPRLPLKAVAQHLGFKSEDGLGKWLRAKGLTRGSTRGEDVCPDCGRPYDTA